MSLGQSFSSQSKSEEDCFFVSEIVDAATGEETSYVLSVIEFEDITVFTLSVRRRNGGSKGGRCFNGRFLLPAIRSRCNKVGKTSSGSSCNESEFGATELNMLCVVFTHTKQKIGVDEQRIFEGMELSIALQANVTMLLML
jgi:hypothetical protein